MQDEVSLKKKKMQFGFITAHVIFHYVLKKTNSKIARKTKGTSNSHQYQTEK